MSNQVYEHIGIQPPMQYNVPFGNIVKVVGHATVDYAQGDCLQLAPTGSAATSYATLDADACEVYTLTTPTGVTALEPALLVLPKVHGILLSDVAALGAGYAMVRGLCMANCESLTTTIGNDAPLYAGDDAGGLNEYTLAHAGDAVAGDYVRVIAMSRWSGTAIATGTPTLIPVLFNGVEGLYDGISIA